jgi:hypothetical protein
VARPFAVCGAAAANFETLMGTRKEPPAGMTLKEFEVRRQEIERESLQAKNLNPISFGLERTRFQKEKLKKLLDTAQGINSLTVKAKVKQWERQLERLARTEERFLRLASETRDISPSRVRLVP